MYSRLFLLPVSCLMQFADMLLYRPKKQVCMHCDGVA